MLTPPHTGVVWQPRSRDRKVSNLARLMSRLQVDGYDEFLKFARENQDRFWFETLDDLHVQFDEPPTTFVDMSQGKAWPKFFPGRLFNFAEACLRAPNGDNGSSQLALIWENEAGECLKLTYEELSLRTKRTAAGLRHIGIQQGDRVGMLMPNIPEAVIAFLAIGFIGAICVPLYSGFGAGPAVQRLQDSGARFLITANGFVRRRRTIPLDATVREIIEEMPELARVVMAAVVDTPIDAPRTVSWRDIELEIEPDSIAPATTATDTPFMVMYTSGTTGKPKGALHVHAGFPLRVVQDAAYLFDFSHGDRLMWVSDMGWMVGPLSIISALMLKGTLVIYDGAPDQPTVGRLRSMAATHGVTHFGSAPTAIRGMAAQPVEALRDQLPSLKILITAGEVIDPEAFNWFFKEFGGSTTPVINYTGGTEVSGAILANSVMRPIAPCCFNSVAPGMSAAVVDSEGNRIVGIPGELAIFEPFVGMTAGFWNAPDRYMESYWNKLPDVWVHGDLAIEHVDGQFELLGRSDDVMKIAGKRVGPSELEALVVDGGKISEAYAVGVPDSTSGEAFILFLVPGSEALADASLDSFASDIIERRMGRPYRPSAVIQVPRLPKTRNGKAVRRLARQAWLGQAAGNLTSLEDPKVFDELRDACNAYRDSKKTR